MCRLNIIKMDKALLLFLLPLLLPTAAPKGSHSLWLLVTFIKGQIPFPEFSCLVMLDDVRVLYYNGDTKTFIRRGNTTNEDDVLNSNLVRQISDYMLPGFMVKFDWIKKNLNTTDIKGPLVIQRLVSCELNDNGEPGQMIVREAFQGTTTDELRYIDKYFTYNSTLNVKAEVVKFHFDISMWRHENIYYPHCIKTQKGYLEKRTNQVNRKVKPIVRLLQKANPDCKGFRVMCLATRFYPRHINLTLFRDGQPVSDDEITGGDLLPNDDGTYQMRKILEISEKEQREKHKYTCTATHLSLDNKMEVKLEYDHGTALKPVLGSVLAVVVLVMVTVAAVVICQVLKAAFKSEYSSASITFSASVESMDTRPSF